MKKITILGILMVLALVSCGENIAKQLETNEFEELLLKEGVQIVDVRTPDEFAQGYIKNAKLIDFNTPEFENQISELDKNKAVAVYCHSGARSNQAFEIMKTMGFREVYELKGGIVAWQQSGKQVLK